MVKLSKIQCGDSLLFWNRRFSNTWFTINTWLFFILLERIWKSLPNVISSSRRTKVSFSHHCCQIFSLLLECLVLACRICQTWSLVFLFTKIPLEFKIWTSQCGYWPWWTTDCFPLMDSIADFKLFSNYLKS